MLKCKASIFSKLDLLLQVPCGAISCQEIMKPKLPRACLAHLPILPTFHIHANMCAMLQHYKPLHWTLLVQRKANFNLNECEFCSIFIYCLFCKISILLSRTTCHQPIISFTLRYILLTKKRWDVLIFSPHLVEKIKFLSWNGALSIGLYPLLYPLELCLRLYEKVRK